MENNKISFEETYITTMGWMVTILNLKGNERTAFALVYGFSQDGETAFRGSINFIAKWLGATRPTAISTMKKLQGRKLVTKNKGTYNGQQCNYYTPNWQTINQLKQEYYASKKFLLPSKDSLPPGSKENIPVGSKDSLPNIIGGSNIDNNIFKDVEGLKKQIGPKHYGLLDEACQDEKVCQKLRSMYPNRFESLMEWLEHRKNIGKQFKVKAPITKLINKFDKYTDEEIQGAVDVAIESGYAGVFPKKKFMPPKEKPALPVAGIFQGLQPKQG